MRGSFVIWLTLFVSTAINGESTQGPQAPPNILFIAIDDMNDGVTLFGRERPFQTPHLVNLAKRGVFFARAYCASPACNPSRAAVITGQRPHRTGVYGNRTDWRQACREIVTLPEYLRRHGYHVEGHGKIYHHHHNGAFTDPQAWDHLQKMDPQFMPPAKLNRAPDYGSANTDWGAWPDNDEEALTIDFRSVSRTIDALKRPRSQPFFLACGIFKPHSPFFAPPRYHTAYPRDVSMPLRKSDDWNDLPSGALTLLRPKQWFWRGMQRLEDAHPGSYRDFVRAYAACCTFADASVGRLIEALDHSPGKGNTIVVLWSDHGFHLGEKDHIEKFALWEKATHVPLIIVDPRRKETAGQICHAPVDLSSLYPTLLELCGLPPNLTNDGISIANQVHDPSLPLARPALMTYGPGNHAIRSEDWRYIRYADGSEELYDHRSDPQEWNNLAAKEAAQPILDTLRRWVPTENAPPFRDLRLR